MMLLRAVPLSLSVLIRMTFLMPIIIVVLALYGIGALVLGVLAAFISPILTALIMGAVSVAASLVILMIAMRQGFSAMSVEARSEATSLFMPALGYGLLDALLMTAISFAISLLAYGSIGGDVFGGLSQVLEGGAIGALAEDVALGRLSVTAVVGLLLLAAARALILIPVASGSIGRDPGGFMHTPLANAGRRFLPLIVAVILAAVLGYVFLPILAEMLPQILPEGDLRAFERTDNWIEKLQHLNWQHIILVALSILWCTCYQAAAAVLAHLSIADERKAVAERSADRQFSGADLRAMRQERARLRDQAG